MIITNTEKPFAVFGTPIQNAVDQMEEALDNEHAVKGALMADHHLGYDVPIGGVIAYRDHVNPAGVGYDIGCGNKAVELEDCFVGDIEDDLNEIMDEVAVSIPSGVGHSSGLHADHEIFDSGFWDIPVLAENKSMAMAQLGSIGSGNHYVDILRDRFNHIWIGVHFGSRGIGHKVATHYINLAKETGGLLDVTTDLGREYIQAMALCGEYARAGRDIVCAQVAEIIGSPIEREVHNHHNFAWFEEVDGEMLWVVRKGATPAYPQQSGFIGATMGESSKIVTGQTSILSGYTMNSTVHGAGRLMSRSQAAGKSKWINGKRTRVAEGAISQEMMDAAVGGVILRGGGLDEAPQAYKRLEEVIFAQGDTIRVTENLVPLGVYMAGE